MLHLNGIQAMRACCHEAHRLARWEADTVDTSGKLWSRHRKERGARTEQGKSRRGEVIGSCCY